jgi:hypothetical protein
MAFARADEGIAAGGGGLLVYVRLCCGRLRSARMAKAGLGDRVGS